MPAKKYDVYGLGNALVDVQAPVPKAFLDEIGYAEGVMTLVESETQVEILGRLGEIDTNRCAGGSAANTIVGVAQFGGKTAYAGKVADDEFGEFFLRDLRGLGVAVEGTPAAAGEHTGTCVVLITPPNAERTMLTHLGAAGLLSAADVDAAEVAAAKYAYLEGYLLTGPDTRSAADAVVEAAVRGGTKVALSTSDPFVAAGFKEDVLTLVDGPVDLLFCNLEEARTLTGETDPRACLSALTARGVDVALTMGPDGSLLSFGGTVTTVDGVPVTAKDTTGAGDMYAAGILYGLTNGEDAAESGRLASAAAARVVGQLGARLADGPPA